MGRLDFPALQPTPSAMTFPSPASPPPARRLSRMGFSLIELLVVIAILGILVALTVSVGPSLVGASGMNGSLSVVSSTVSLARSEAIRSRKQTYFALAPESPADARSFVAYAILRREGTNFSYVRPWKKLPTGVLFHPEATTNSLPEVELPDSQNGDALRSMRVISFVSDGSLEEDLHPLKPRLPLQAGSLDSASGSPTYHGNYLTNEIVVERMSGKVKVAREGDSNP